jgi:mercuric ion binding protein
MKSVSTFLLLLLSGTVFAAEVKAEIKVSGMTCGACSVSVKSALTRVKGVKIADVSYEKGLATVVYDDQQTTERQLRQAINKTGFKAEANPEKK